MTKRLISAVLMISVIISSLTLFAASVSATVQDMANIVVFVRYATDTENSFADAENYTKINAIFNDTSDLNANIGVSVDYSFKNYISTVSRGKVNVKNYFPQDTSSSFNVLTLDYSREHYTDDFYIIGEVLDAFENNTLTLPADKLDNVEAEILDCLMIITQASSNDFPDDDVLYPHKGNYGAGSSLCNRYYVRNYVMIDSGSLLNGQKQGVVSHEFMHVIGYPDLYRYSGEGSPVGIWDLMASTSPYQQYPLSYMRSLFGWVPLGEITQSGTYTLNAATSESGNVVYKFQTPLSDSEYFALEYRVRNTDTVAGLGFESKVNTGLLVYRINNGISEKANSAGNDYVYVFRPGETSLTDSGGNIMAAAINPAEGETSYGSADFDAPFTDDTIFYSSGKNSGITLSNITASPDNSTITFTITFPDYSGLDIWDKSGSSFGSSMLGYADTAVAENGDIYVAAINSGDWSYSAEVWKYNGAVWSRLGAAFAGAYDGRLAVRGNDVYFVYSNDSGNPVVSKYNGTAWVRVATDNSALYPSSLDLCTDGTDVYLTYIRDGNTAVIKKVLTNGLEDIDDSLTSANSFANIAITPYDGDFYAVYSYFGFNLPEKRTIVSKLDMTSGIWSTVQTLAIENANTHCAVVRDGKLYVLSGATAVAPALAVFDGTAWTSETASLPDNSYAGLSIDAIDGEIYISYLCDNSLKLAKMTNGIWQNYSEVSPDCSGFDTVSLNGSLYIASASAANGNMTVYTRSLRATPVLTITASSYILNSGSTLALTASVTPSSAMQTLIWSTSNPSIATVNSSGVVTGGRNGNATITATAADGSFSAHYGVTVRPSVSSVVIFNYGRSNIQKVNWWRSYSSAKMRLGYRVYNCDDAVRFVWKSSSGRVHISPDGWVTNTGSGCRSATITVTGYNSSGVMVVQNSIKVGFYKLDRQLERISAQGFGDYYEPEINSQSETVAALFEGILPILTAVLSKYKLVFLSR